MRAVTYAVINDVHLPYENLVGLKAMIAFLHKVPCDEIILNGDIVDAFSISKFIKNPKYISNDTDYEIEKLEDFISKLKKITPRITYILGNHEMRVVNHLWKHEAFSKLGINKGLELSNLTFAKIYGLDAMNIKTIDYGKGIWLGKKNSGLYVTHGTICRKFSSYTCKSEQEMHNCSTLTGHVHRQGIHIRNRTGGILKSYENFCMCDLNPDYIQGKADWTNGFSLVHILKNKFYVEQIPIEDGVIFYGGKEYS